MGLPSAAAIVGVGTTDFSKASGRSELRLAVEASLAALDDAGVPPEEVDGMVTFAIDNNDEPAVARNLGTNGLTYFGRTPMGGGGAAGTIATAAMAIVTGKAKTIVCYRAMNERSQMRFGQPAGYDGTGPADSWLIDTSFTSPFGMATAASSLAQSARRYMHQYGASSEDFGRQAVIQREFAVTNPNAYFYNRPMTLDDHQSSRMISDPLRMLDCCMETDAGVALVITSADRAKDLRHPVVEIAAGAMGVGVDQHGIATVYRDNIATAEETRIVGEQLWRESGLSPSDMDVAILYDHFSCAVLMQLEALGFCGLGEAPGLIKSGGTRIDGVIPVNTNGGQLSEAYVHGFNGMVEAVRQVRGTAVNQVPDARTAVVTGGSHVQSSGMVLVRR